MIAAVDQHWGIGYQGKILEHIPEDLQFFKSVVYGNPAIMGRKTYESLPKKVIEYFCGSGIVMTHQGWHWDKDNGVLYSDMESIESQMLFDDVTVIGGASVYETWLPRAEKIYLTHIYKEHENVDAYFPALDENKWKCIAQSDIHYFGDIPYQFKTYSRY